MCLLYARLYSKCFTYVIYIIFTHIILIIRKIKPMRKTFLSYFTVKETGVERLGN